MNKFEHLKKSQPSISLDSFIAGANQDSRAKKTRKRPSKDSLLLVATGRVASIDIYDKAGLLYLKKDLKEDIEKYCSGNKQILLNYLIRRGLDDLISKGERIVEEAD